MDRNAPPHRQKRRHPTVATREGGVDRNQSVYVIVSTLPVATREGGVDRNIQYAVNPRMTRASPPARVAWIETSVLGRLEMQTVVATREGGVDRNVQSAIREYKSSNVATREGGVDRNDTARKKSLPPTGRHPRGWRG